MKKCQHSKNEPSKKYQDSKNEFSENNQYSKNEFSKIYIQYSKNELSKKYHYSKNELIVEWRMSLEDGRWWMKDVIEGSSLLGVSC